MTTSPLTDEELNQIESTITDEHLTPGPWDLAYESCDCGGDYPCGHGPYVTGVITPVPTSIAADRCKRMGEEPRDYDFHRGEIGDFTEADWVLMVSARQNVSTLLAEIRRLRDERDELRGKFADAAASLAEQVLRYGQRQREHNADREELERLRDAMGQIWQLHKDSPMGPCPVCIDADAAAAGGDGLVPYPCPTARLAGAQDCDPPSFRAAAVPAAVETGAACGKCKTPFDQADTRFDGRAQYETTPYCLGCIDNCHEGGTEHVCVICDPARYGVTVVETGE